MTNIIAEFVRTDQTHSTMLRVYENKKGLRGTLLNSYLKKICTKQFYSKGKDAVNKVKKHYGFTDNNSYASCTDYTLDYEY